MLIIIYSFYVHHHYSSFFTFIFFLAFHLLNLAFDLHLILMLMNLRGDGSLHQLIVVNIDCFEHFNWIDLDSYLVYCC